MTCCPGSRWIVGALLVLPAVAGAVVWDPQVTAQQEQPAAQSSDFASPTIDIGLVVSDADAAVEFYTKVIGFQESGEFSVPPSLASDSGLTAPEKPFDVKVLTLTGAEGATKLKIIEFTNAKPKSTDQQYIHSSRGLSYLTIFVNDTNAAMERLQAAGIKPLAQGPVELPESLAKGVYLTVVKDPDGNFVELVGPKAK